MKEYVLRLYVTGRTSRAERAIANLHQLCREVVPERYEIEIVDVLDHPEKAEEDKILATPTLVRYLPPPIRRVVGDLSLKDKVISGLGLGLWPDLQEDPSPKETTAHQ